jgi:hypothetical protein
LLPFLAKNETGVAVRAGDGSITHLTAQDVVAALATGVAESTAIKD